jgi:hypothetical protein
MKRCIKCKLLRELDEFHYKNGHGSERSKTCKECTQLYVAERAYRNKLGIPHKDKFQIAREAKQTREEFEVLVAKEILTDLGYEVDSDISVYEQFLIRHNLI